ncbi:alpha/beta hydrolase family protein [Martelella mediterranea]|uniref:Putative dienelactone hydrolase n=1 Tax=Martelella mediterranea TaxID=293089 RepID=A0A4R3NWR1_9HYPH|nr:alpha/beta fold hydrolase [Martelella mediterranea]TCT42803.1 putative dienelactone hydrolase [Martelella mediterranea]
MKRLILSLVTSLMLAGSAAAAENLLPGYERLTVESSARTVPLAATLWYPAKIRSYRGIVGGNAVFQGTSGLMGARIADGQFPLFLFSHGSGGNMDNSAWLMAGLAEKGAMVLAVNHPGSTTGDSSPRASAFLDRRAGDLSAALDYLLADPVLGPHVDQSAITASGFSLGGATALNLGGMRVSGDAFADYCRENPGYTDCIFMSKGNLDFDRLPEGFGGDLRDERVGAVIAIDPGFTYAATEASIETMSLPVLVISLGKEHLLPATDLSESGSNFLARLPDAAHETFAPASHFTFLALCKPEGAAFLAEEQDDPVCTDPEGTDRAAVHAAIVDAIARFIGL